MLRPTCCSVKPRCVPGAHGGTDLFSRSLAAAPDSVARTWVWRAYVALGDYASARIEFETVLRFDGLPPDVQQQAEIYAQAAEDYAAGRRC